MLGFSYDWDRELATTDVEYFRWTQWIFLVLFDTWFDAEQQKGRPISELPIPAEVKSQGEAAVRKYQDEHRLAYQSDALVNWCPELGTVLANEEVIDGKSERGGHPVVRMPLRQWMLRITAYADRLEKDLEGARLARGHQEAAARLDRPERRGGGGFLTSAQAESPITRRGKPDTATFERGKRSREVRLSRKARATTCCASTPRGPTRCSARPTWSSRRSIRSSTG